MGNAQNIIPENGTKIPPNYPKFPTFSKLEILWNANSKSLYHKLSPYSSYTTGLIHGFTSQPFYYTYIDEKNKGLNYLRKYDSRSFPAGSGPIDVIRVSKFLGSGNGILFLGKQFLLQTGNAFNETRIYNPTSPIVAAANGIALGTIRPNRNFDTSAGIAGIAGSVLGGLGKSIFGSSINPPSGTASGALAGGPNINTGGKGLIRAGTASIGKAHLESIWINQGKQNISFGGIVKNAFKSVFQNFIPQTQDGITYRSDEGTYGLMIAGGNKKFSYLDKNGNTFEFGQMWVAGGNIIRKDGQYPSYSNRLFVDSNGNPKIIKTSNIKNLKSINNVDKIGYDVEESNTDTGKPVKYADSIGTARSNIEQKDFTNSDIMVQYGLYVEPDSNYVTKKTDTNAINKNNEEMLKVLNKLRNVSGKLYTVDIPSESKLISSGAANNNGYDKIFNVKNKSDVSTGINYKLGVLQDYRQIVTLDDTVGSNNPSKPSKRFSSAGKYDAINTLNVLSKKNIQSLNSSTPNKNWTNLKLKGWETRQWNPSSDDQIAFYFYDVVNEKYIPFRATVKGLSESGNASWEELQFIGRADKVYSYGGFNRNLSLTFTVVIGSIAELAPTWQRINYLTTLIKPANYTTATDISKGQSNQSMNRFMVPPMIMMTIGDLYKDQPILIQSITTTVPDDSSWETLNEDNMGSLDWQYLASYIKSPGVLYGQLPRTVDISLGLALLEKERAIVGGANFGNAPRNDNLDTWNTSTSNNGRLNELDMSLVVTNDDSQIKFDSSNLPINNIIINQPPINA